MTDTLKNLWDKAYANLETPIPIGEAVFCDFCGNDYTNSPEKGGLMFGSYATCPKCEPEIRADAKQFEEEDHITATPHEGESFADFIRRYRGPDAFIRVSNL